MKKGLVGNADLGLPPTDPLKVDKITVKQELGPVSLNANFRDLDLRGLAKAQIYKISGFKKEPGKSKMEISFRTPFASAVGAYNVDGRILVLPIGGNGTIKLDFGKQIFLFDTQLDKMEIF